MYFYDPCSSESNILKFERVKARDERDNLERERARVRAKWRERELTFGEEGRGRRLLKNALKSDISEVY